MLFVDVHIYGVYMSMEFDPLPIFRFYTNNFLCKKCDQKHSFLTQNGRIKLINLVYFLKSLFSYFSLKIWNMCLSHNCSLLEITAKLAQKMEIYSMYIHTFAEKCPKVQILTIKREKTGIFPFENGKCFTFLTEHHFPSLWGTPKHL